MPLRTTRSRQHSPEPFGLSHVLVPPPRTKRLYKALRTVLLLAIQIMLHRRDSMAGGAGAACKTWTGISAKVRIRYCRRK